jgi:DNA-binding NarL/FixJ family response regulator
MKDSQRAVSVLLADDHTLIREAIAEMLESDKEIKVVGQAENGAEAVALAGEKRPDVVLLDVEMPVMGAEEAIERITGVSPSSKVVILTMHDDAGLVRGLLARGASAYLVKTVSRDELLSTVKSMADGEDHVILSLSREALKKSRNEGMGGLSERELEILLYIARGMSNRQIASLLYITEGTVKRHLHNVYVKLDVASRGEATRKALSEGWITARDITRIDE